MYLSKYVYKDILYWIYLGKYKFPEKKLWVVKDRIGRAHLLKSDLGALNWGRGGGDWAESRSVADVACGDCELS